ncbi:AraC family transcriptional regulator [Actinomadura atramentaria]|uniref:AraC family transcriptional regulator n=1 Tax=Actinomadura atramentaria TaxID=1990 RepID=UPI00035F144A|nr:AraC family transcriptional regulator [Actinomadura atramentaria]
MDALADLLDGPRAHGAFLLRATFAPPWSVEIRDRAPLTLMVMVRGEAWLRGDGAAAGSAAGSALLLRPGDVAVARGPDGYTLGDDPAAPPDVVVHPGQRCAAPDGTPMTEEMTFGPRAWGTDPDGPDVMLVGTYGHGGAVTGRLLAALPPLLVVPGGERGNGPGGTVAAALAALLEAEIRRDEPGQDVVLDRLLDVLLIAVLRSWFARPDAAPPGWYRAHGDAVVGPALRLLHADPARPWTVAALAAATGASRAAFARRFAALVGEPPMAYLTGLRLARAADLLRETGVTLDAVARRVGYATPFALSTAFKRAHGVSPQEYRTRAAAD